MSKELLNQIQERCEENLITTHELLAEQEGSELTSEDRAYIEGRTKGEAEVRVILAYLADELGEDTIVDAVKEADWLSEVEYSDSIEGAAIESLVLVRKTEEDVQKSRDMMGALVGSMVLSSIEGGDSGGSV